MKSFDDELPAEQEEKQSELIALLRQAYSQEEALSESQQQEAIRRVEERLEGIALPDSHDSERSALMARASGRSVRTRPLGRIMSTLAAVLVVCVLVGSTVLLLTGHPRSQIDTRGQASPTDVSSLVDVSQAGLEMSMRVTPGPYFLGELLAIDLSLTNRAHATLRLGGRSSNFTVDNPCGPPNALVPQQTGGVGPYYSLYTKSVPYVYSCPAELLPGPNSGTPLVPGQTVAGRFYLFLTASGDVTLTGGAFFYVPGSGGQAVWQRNAGPLTGHLPTLHIHVASQAPANRILQLQHTDTMVQVNAPAGVQLEAQTYIVCESSINARTPAGANLWEPVAAHELPRPQCLPRVSAWINGQLVTPSWNVVLWKYAIGAAGYEVEQGCIGTGC